MSHAFMADRWSIMASYPDYLGQKRSKVCTGDPEDGTLTIEERFNSLGFSQEYFVITDFNQLDRYHPDMKEYLRDHCPVVAQSKDYLSYAITRDNCRHASFRSDHLG
jgi:hypothetical protein